MKRWSSLFFLPTVLISVLLITPQAFGAKSVAKVTSYKGDVVILSDGQFIQVTKAGMDLKDGDRVQTKEGEAEVAFWDGSVMKVSPFTSTMVQEREEESGWLFKSKTLARRLTVFVGKLGFKSGSSPTKNFLQTPTAICGLRGSEADFGTDGFKNFLNQISGGSDTIGEFARGFFQNPGPGAAANNPVFQQMASAYQSYQQALQSGSALDKANAELAGLQAIKAAAESLQNNPDPTVKNQANTVLNETNTKIQQKQQEISQIPTTVGGTTTSTGETTSGTVAEATRPPITIPPLTLPSTLFPTTTTSRPVSGFGP